MRKVLANEPVPELQRRLLRPGCQGLGYQAMVVGSAGAQSTLPNAMTQARAFGLGDAQARAVAAEVANVVKGWKRHFRRAGATPADIDLLAQYLDGPRLGEERRGIAKTRAR